MASHELDPELIKQARAGDKPTLEALLRAVEPDLRAEVTIAPIWRRALDSDDVLQVSYEDLHGLAVAKMNAENPNHTL